MTPAARELQIERKVFEDHLEEWRSTHMGEFVLIKETDIIGFFPSLKETFDKGTEIFGLAPFFVQQILPEGTVNVSFFGERILSA